MVTVFVFLFFITMKKPEKRKESRKAQQDSEQGLRDKRVARVRVYDKRN